MPVHDLAGRSGKLDRLTEMLEEVVAAKDQALVFTQFAEMGHVLHDYLQNALSCPVLYLHGGTPPTQRDRSWRLRGSLAPVGGRSRTGVSLRRLPRQAGGGRGLSRKPAENGRLRVHSDGVPKSIPSAAGEALHQSLR